MLNALRYVRPSHLLDQDVARALADRDPEIRQAVAPEPRTRHAAAEPVMDGKLRLRVVEQRRGEPGDAAPWRPLGQARAA